MQSLMPWTDSMHSGSQVSGNVGEWSELYALGNLLANGGAYAANKNQQKIATMFYQVIRIFSNENPNVVYEVGGVDVTVLKNGVLQLTIPKGTIDVAAQALMNDLRHYQPGRSFTLATGQALLNTLTKKAIKTPSTISADLEAILRDLQTQQPTPRLGFSIKSQMGAPSTLFNSSHSTNLIYQVNPPTSGTATLPTFAKQSEVKKNLRALLAAGYTLSFDSYESSQFETNLKYIDSNLPNYLSDIMLDYYLSRSAALSKIAPQTFPATDPNSAQKIQKIKEFLHQVTIGLRPNQPWTTTQAMFGGLILVKSNGDVFIYYLYNLQDFMDYLYENIRFETPLATRHGFATVYQDNGKDYIKLNLQLRFKR